MTKDQEKRLKPLLKKLIMEVKTELKEADYHRLDKKTIGNDLYQVQSDVKDLFDSLNNGNDFHPERIDVIIKLLLKIKKAAVKFDSGTHPIDKDYR